MGISPRALFFIQNAILKDLDYQILVPSQEWRNCLKESAMYSEAIAESCSDCFEILLHIQKELCQSAI